MCAYAQNIHTYSEQKKDWWLFSNQSLIMLVVVVWMISFCLSEFFQFSTVNISCFYNKNTRKSIFVFFFLKTGRQNQKRYGKGKKKYRGRVVGTTDQSHKDLKVQKQNGLRPFEETQGHCSNWVVLERNGIWFWKHLKDQARPLQTRISNIFL